MSEMFEWLSRTCLLSALCLSFCCVPTASAEAPKTGSSKEAGVSPGASKTETMPLESFGKKESRNDVKIEYVEQKRFDANAPLNEFGKKSPEARSLSEMCELYEGKIVSFAGSVAVVEKCRQRVVEDPQVFNDLLIEKKMSVVDVSSRVVRTIPFGAPFEKKDMRSITKTKGKSCEKMEGRYVTTDGDSFYFVEKCTRRAFLSFEDFVSHNADNRPVLAATPEELDAYISGSAMQVKKKEDSRILYKVDGDVYWSRLFPAGKVDRSAEDSLHKYEKIDEERSALSKRGALCARYKGKIVSFYSKIFYIEKCLRRPLLNVSLDVQTLLFDGFGPQDIPAEQYRAIPEGEGLDAESLVKTSRLKTAPN